MSYPLEQQYRELCADTMQHNLEHISAPESRLTVEDMIRAASIPYDAANKDHVGDTLDRYSWSPYGNALEVTVLAYLQSEGDDQALICRSLENQHGRKLDIATTNRTIQVKRARIGTFGDLFVSKDETKGEATWIVFVDGANRKLYILDREVFRSYVREREWAAIEPWKFASIDRTTDTIGWHLKTGWAVESGWLKIVDIPNFILVPYYDYRTKTVEVK